MTAKSRLMVITGRGAFWLIAALLAFAAMRVGGARTSRQPRNRTSGRLPAHFVHPRALRHERRCCAYARAAQGTEASSFAHQPSNRIDTALGSGINRPAGQNFNCMSSMRIAVPAHVLRQHDPIRCTSTGSSAG